MRKTFGLKLIRPDLVFPKGPMWPVEHALYICFKHLPCPKDKNNVLKDRDVTYPHTGISLRISVSSWN